MGSCCNAQFGRLIIANELCYSPATLERATLEWSSNSRLKSSRGPPSGHVYPHVTDHPGPGGAIIHMGESVKCVYLHRKHRPMDLLSIAIVMS